MVLIREAQELARHPSPLQNVEQHDAFRFWQTVIEGVVDNKLRCCPVEDMVGWIPSLVVLTIIPESAIELQEC